MLKFSTCFYASHLNTSSDNKLRKVARADVLRKAGFWHLRENDMLGVSHMSLLSVVSDKSRLLGRTDGPGRTQVCRQTGNSRAPLLSIPVLWLLPECRLETKFVLPLFIRSSCAYSRAIFKWVCSRHRNTNKQGERHVPLDFIPVNTRQLEGFSRQGRSPGCGAALHPRPPLRRTPIYRRQLAQSSATRACELHLAHLLIKTTMLLTDEPKGVQGPVGAGVAVFRLKDGCLQDL